jgi:hypothetical protein
MHAWDLPSLLIDPFQDLLKYSFLTAILEEIPYDHPDKENLKLAKQKMEEVARTSTKARDGAKSSKRSLTVPGLRV